MYKATDFTSPSWSDSFYRHTSAKAISAVCCPLVALASRFFASSSAFENLPRSVSSSFRSNCCPNGDLEMRRKIMGKAVGRREWLPTWADNKQ